MISRKVVKCVVISAFICSFAFAGFEGNLTPQGDYSTPKGQTLAQKYSSNISKIMTEISGVYSANALRPLSLQESMVGGGGFWKNPAKFGTDSRYMGVLYYAVKPQYIFGDDRNGHVASVLDKYGKFIIETMTKQIQAINDPAVDGVAICIIWGDSVNGNPAKTGQEGMALFLSKADLLQYKDFKLTIQNLVNRNDLFLFSGPMELENLTQFIIEA